MEKQEAIIFKTDDGNIRFHKLKTWIEFYNAVIEPNLERRKHLDLRLKDRDYRVGDYLLLEEYNPETKKYTGRNTWRLITHIVEDIPHLTEGYIGMSIIEKIPSIRF